NGAGQAAGGVPEVLRAATHAATEALARTPEQLPRLREAGVVDAGGQGVVAFLEGALAFVEDHEPALQVQAAPGGLGSVVRQEFLEHTADDEYGFCTQFIISGERLDVAALREQVSALAVSTAVVGDERLVRVHAHATDPGPLLSLAVRAGELNQVKIENMDAMHRDFIAKHGRRAEAADVAVVAVASGAGLERLFRDMGAAAVVRGGQTMNPSAKDLLDAAERTNARRVIVLPNNANVALAADQAARMAKVPCTVIPSRNIPQGIAAMLAFNPDLDADANAGAMRSAMRGVRSGEVTVAVRDTTVGGVRVASGQPIGLLDDELVCAGASLLEALERTVAAAEPTDGGIVTLYRGEGLTEAEALAAAAALRRRWPGAQVDVVEAGQPHYRYLFSVE
ncbi:MAG: DAK2 domain-containing protein, partial [SAR202 cluster bacterium]|nr:DAK2 domain-containing protein [SAR202 cluster bacterium]